MTNFLVSVYSTLKSKQHFIIDIIEAENENEAEKKVIGKIYYSDSDQKKILGKCKKAIVINRI
jgi:hypothetical protein